MMVKLEDTTDFYWSRRMGNRLRDALKVGELSCPSGRDNAEPSFGHEEGVETGWAPPTSLTRYGEGTVRTTKAKVVAKAIVVRKSVARKGIRVRIPVIPIYGDAINVESRTADSNRRSGRSLRSTAAIFRARSYCGYR
jgi:hypothetical protein